MNPTRVRLDVRRFGTGYWIGAVSVSLFGALQMLLPLLISPDDHSTSPLSALLLVSQSAIVLIGIIAGGAISMLDIAEGVEAKDRNHVLGGLIGFLLCAWPPVCLAATLLQH